MTYVIAEAGVNHNGSVKEGLKLIDAAKECGADAVKFQMFTPELLEPSGPRRNMLERLWLAEPHFCQLKEFCRKTGIEFICTPFDTAAVEYLDGLGVEKIKISSGNLGNESLLEAAAKTGCDLILSTGMAEMQDIWHALRTIGWERVTLLHCTSAYPAPIEDVNLRAMETMRDAFHCPVGLSDHSSGIVVPVAAVALGAEVIEKHLTLDCFAEGPDHQASLEPYEFMLMVKEIRTVEKAMGDGIKKPRPSEKAVMKIRGEREAYRAVG